MRLEQIIEKIEENGSISEVKIERFIPVLVKRVVVDNVVNLTTFINEDTGMMEVDILFKEMLLSVFKVLNLTDIETDDIFVENDEDEDILNFENIAKIYDDLTQYRILQHIESQLENDDLREIIDIQIQQRVDNYNSPARVLTEFLQSLPSKDEIANLVSSLPNQLKDLNNLEVLNPSKGSKVSKSAPKKPKTKTKPKKDG